MEFIPVDYIKQTVFDLFGIEYEAESGKDESSYESESEPLFDKFYVFVLIAAVIVFAVVLMILLRLLAMVCPIVLKCFEALKRTIFYKSLIRYVLFGTLKIQLEVASILLIGIVTDETKD